MSNTNSFKIQFYVDGDKTDNLNGVILDMPIIPRKGDFVSLSYKIGKSNFSGVFAVDRVYINQLGSSVDAQVNVKI